MTTNLRSTIHAELGWTWRDLAGSALITNSNRLRLVQDLDDGHDENQAEAVWDAADQTLAAGGSTTFELDALEREMFGDTVYVSLLTVKAILIVQPRRPATSWWAARRPTSGTLRSAPPATRSRSRPAGRSS